MIAWLLLSLAMWITADYADYADYGDTLLNPLIDLSASAAVFDARAPHGPNHALCLAVTQRGNGRKRRFSTTRTPPRRDPKPEASN
jgi:hypothetical protein